jgi:hypothetical protein
VQEQGACHLGLAVALPMAGGLQLTSGKARPEAIRFYEGLGFVASHEGMKLPPAGDGGR